MRQKLAGACKRKAVDDICQRPQKIILGEIQTLSNNNFTTTDVSCIRQTIYRTRRQFFPTNPESISELHTIIDHTEILTTRGEQFLLHNDHEKNIIIFSCDTNLKFLCNSKSIYVDGTFQYCPKHFVQLFTIHGYINNYYVPLVFCLLKNKFIETYKEAFEVIKYKCTEKKLLLYPENITVDFEVSIHKAALIVWPLITIIGCRFHLTQSWYRKLQELGLSNAYKTCEWLKGTFGLTFLNPEDVSDCFVDDFMTLIPEGTAFIQYADYLIDNYISEESKYPPKIWALMDPSLARTTNNCESFHSHFNDQFYKAHPSINIFLKILIENVQSYNYIKIYSSNNAISISVRSKIEIRSNKTKEAIDKYNKKEISRLEFVKLVSNNYRKLYRS
ncbi:uncharacterized protein LOC126908469 [Daktulosphaira vitifoliae]|uniref:uncharacterized protein LOC126908469 n=1 Tax=Daktulosphaira vitifoliae TaxID=58002 RepID=UPI0021AAE25C|nr:uncharacterized protein LOC126908469 [Daktulosphaira vitifoliae]